MPPTNCVEVVRHTYDCFEVVAYDLFGRIVRHRMYVAGKKRRQWAIQQATEWADQLGLWWDGKIWN